MTVTPRLPINPATGLPWTAADADALRAQIDTANAALGGDAQADIVTETLADEVEELGGDAAITDPAERVSLGLPPLGTPPPVEPPPVVVPPTEPTLSDLSAHVDDLETRVTENTAAIAALQAAQTPAP